MEKRKMIFGSYDTALTGLWTLTEWALSAAEYKQNFMEVPGRDGALDLSATLTNGEPKYGSRTLSAVFESSEGSRLERKARMDTMVNWLSGWRMNIELPDDPEHYLVGRVQVEPLYNDMAHASVQVTAVCDPWLYAKRETRVFVPLCGKNLFNHADLEVLFANGTELSAIDTGVRATWTGHSSAFAILRLFPISQLAGKSVTLSVNAAATGNNRSYVVMGYGSADGTVRKSKVALEESGTVTLNVEDTGEYKYVILWLYASTGVAVSDLTQGDYVDYTNLQIEIGDTATEYEDFAVVSPQAVTLTNHGRRTVSPTIVSQGELLVEYNGGSQALADGTYMDPGLQLSAGSREVQVSGEGAVAFVYREAVL